jgi:hypothetical protein
MSLEPYNNPFWDFSNGVEKINELPKIVAYLSCSAGHTHYAQTKSAHNFLKTKYICTYRQLNQGII